MEFIDKESIISFIRKETDKINDINIVVKTALQLYETSEFNTNINKIEIPIEKFESYLSNISNMRLHSRYKKINVKTIKTKVKSKLAFRILRDIGLYGDGTYNGITQSLNRDYFVTISNKTILSYLEKLNSSGWIGSYRLITGLKGSRPKFFYIKDIGNEFNINQSKFW